MPVLDTVYFGENPKFQRFIFRAESDSVSVADESQFNILQNVNVFSLTEPLDPDAYFARTEVKHGGKRVTKGVPVYDGTDSLSFEFTEEYGKQYLGITQSDLEDMTAYTKKFPGIYISTDDPIGEGGRINLFKMAILEPAQAA